MNSLTRKIQLRKERIAEERRKAEEEKYLASLSEEERAAYLKGKEEQGRRAMRLLASTMAIAGAFAVDAFYINLEMAKNENSFTIERCRNEVNKMSKKLVLELSIYDDGDWGFDESIFANYTSKYFDTDLYEYTYFEDYTTKVRRVYEEDENGLDAICAILKHICKTLHGRESYTESVAEFFEDAIAHLKHHKTFYNDMDGNTEIELSVSQVDNDSKRIKQIIYEE